MTDEELNELLKVRGWLTIDEQVQPGPLDGFLAHSSVTSYEKLREWADMKHRELVRYKAFYELGIWTETENEDYHLGQLTQIKDLVANLRQIDRGY